MENLNDKALKIQRYVKFGGVVVIAGIASIAMAVAGSSIIVASIIGVAALFIQKVEAQRYFRECFYQHLNELKDSGSPNWQQVDANNKYISVCRRGQFSKLS